MTFNLTDAEEARLLDLSLINGDLLALLTVAGTETTLGTEMTGGPGPYARQALTYGAAVAGSPSTKANSAALAFPGLDDGDIQGWAILDTTGVDRKWWGLFNPQSGTAQNSGDTITLNSHGLTLDQKIVFQSGYVPAGLVANTTYFARTITTNTFQVAATAGGAAIAITADSTLVQWGKVKTVVTTGDSFSVPIGALVCSLD